jgi:hypothetical protein
MNFRDISNLRLINQQIADSEFNRIKDLAGWMGALQAQDYNGVKWAIGLRVPGTNDAMIEEAIERADIIRTHLLRPTWHFVSSDDIYWVLELSAPQIRSVCKSRDRDLGITGSIIQKSFQLLEKILSGGKRLTRAELREEFKRENIETDDNRLYHFLMHAEINGLIFSRYSGTNRQTYSLLSETVPKTKTFTRDEALANLASRYFRSHGPATVQDFSWWSGLSLTESKRALEINLPDFMSETTENQTFWFSSALTVHKQKEDTLFLLPAFDEFIISYRNRIPSIRTEHQNKAFSSNGIFRPMIVAGGQVIGTWKQTLKKDKVLLETAFFQSTDDGIPDMILNAAKPLSVFFNKQIELIR